MDADEDCLIGNYRHQNQEQDFRDGIVMKVSLAQCLVSESILELVLGVESTKKMFNLRVNRKDSENNLLWMSVRLGFLQLLML